MRLLKCLKNEAVLEYVSIASEMSRQRLLLIRAHLVFCKPCRAKSESFAKRWESFFQPEPDLTSSLMRVYSSLQKDETLVLKGWKLNDSRLLAGRWYSPWSNARAKRNVRSLLWGGGLGSAVAALLTLFLWNPARNSPSPMAMSDASARFNAPDSKQVPFAQIRWRDKNRVQVHYVQPELLRTIEFETTDHR